MLEIGLTLCKKVFFKARLPVFSRLKYEISNAVMMQRKMETGCLMWRKCDYLYLFNLIDSKSKKREDLGRIRRKLTLYLSSTFVRAIQLRKHLKGVLNEEKGCLV